MKILYVLSSYPNFSESFIQNEMSHLENLGHEVQVLNLRSSSTEQVAKNSIINSRFNSIGYSQAVFRRKRYKSSILANPFSGRISAKERIKRTILYFSYPYYYAKAKQYNPAIIVSHFLFTSTFAASKIAMELGCKHYLRLHTSYSTLSKRIVQNILENSHNLSAISFQLIDHIKNYYGYKKEIECVRQDINLNELLQLKSKEYRVNSHLLAIGRFVPKKGFNQLLQALSILKNEGEVFSLSIYGEGPLKEDLQKLTIKLNLSDIVMFKGVLNHSSIMHKIQSASVLVVPSNSLHNDLEGIPTVIPEAMALRTIVMSTNVGAVSEIIEHNKTGYILNNESAETLARSISDAMKDQNNWKKIKKKANEKVFLEYNKRFSV